MSTTAATADQSCDPAAGGPRLPPQRVMAPASAPAARPALHDPAHAGPVRDEHLLQPHGLEGRTAQPARVRRARQLQRPTPGPFLPRGDLDQHPADGVPGDRRADSWDRVRDSARPQVLRPRHRPHDADHAVPAHTRGDRADLEEPDVPRALRSHQLADREGRRHAHRVRLAAPDLVDRHHAGLAVDPVHDADHARRTPEHAPGRRRGREGRRVHAVRDLPSAHARRTCVPTWSWASCWARST